MNDSMSVIISDDSDEAIYNLRTRGMTVPGGMIVETVMTTMADTNPPSITSVFVPQSRMVGDVYSWLESRRIEPTGNTH